MQEIRVFVAHDRGLSGDWVADHVPAESGVEIVQSVDTLSPTDQELAQIDADVLLVACSEASDVALELVERWAAARGRHGVIMLCRSSVNGFVQRAFEAGADDLLVLDPGPEVSPAISRQLKVALEKAVVRRRGAAQDGGPTGTLICVLGPKGGIGKTMTSCNLALSLVGKRRNVVLVDLDLQFGDVALSLGLRPEATSYDLSISGGSLDVDKIDAYLVTHSSGLRVLAAPVRPDQTSVITTDFMAEVIAALRSRYDYVVVDTPPAMTPEVIATIDASSYICMVGMLDALSLKNTRLGLETLDLMGYPPDRIRVLLNRSNTSVGITGRDVESILGRAPDILVPSSRDIARAVNQGEPIVLGQKRSEAARAFRTLADLLSQPAGPLVIARGKRRKLLGRRRS